MNRSTPSPRDATLGARTPRGRVGPQNPLQACGSFNPRLAPAALSTFLAALLVFVPGCALTQQGSRVLTPSYRPRNVFVWNSALPANLRRIAFLPMGCEQTMPEMVDARDVLEPIVSTELAKLHRFEIVPISSEALEAKTGQAAWSCEEALPGDLFAWLNDFRGCDAVLFCRLTVFHG